jgi:hypothetical protein
MALTLPFLFLLSFLLPNVPATPPVELTICSPFDPGEGLGGWFFGGAEYVAVDEDEGRGANSIRLGDKLGPVSYGIAPQVYRGSWNVFNGSGLIEFDLKIEASNPSDTLLVEYNTIELSGPGGRAVVKATASEILQAVGQWHRLQFPVSAGAWVMQAGNWEALMGNVTQIRVTLEYIYGTETVWFDNFCVWNSPAANTVEQAAAADIAVYPNPTGDRRITIEHKSGQALERVALFDLSGRRVLFAAQIGTSQYQLECRDLPAGTYVLQVEYNGARVAQKVVLF